MAVRYGWCFVYARIAWWFESMNSDTLFEIVAKQLLFVVCVSRDTAQWHALHNGHSSHSTQTHTQPKNLRLAFDFYANFTFSYKSLLFSFVCCLSFDRWQCDEGDSTASLLLLAVFVLYSYRQVWRFAYKSNCCCSCVCDVCERIAFGVGLTAQRTIYIYWPIECQYTLCIYDVRRVFDRYFSLYVWLLLSSPWSPLFEHIKCQTVISLNNKWICTRVRECGYVANECEWFIFSLFRWHSFHFLFRRCFFYILSRHDK